MPKLFVTQHNDGKLEGIQSLNVDPLSIDFCNAMASRPGTVCEKCYARRLLKFRANARRRYKANLQIMLDENTMFAFPRFTSLYVRLHSFGEIVSYSHVCQLYSIVEANPERHFALWTKRPEYISMMHRAKPRNLSLVYSVSELNPKEEQCVLPPGFDHTYAVYKDAPQCGDKCLDCLKCWSTAKHHLIRQGLH